MNLSPFAILCLCVLLTDVSLVQGPWQVLSQTYSQCSVTECKFHESRICSVLSSTAASPLRTPGPWKILGNDNFLLNGWRNPLPRDWSLGYRHFSSICLISSIKPMEVLMADEVRGRADWSITREENDTNPQNEGKTTERARWPLHSHRSCPLWFQSILGPSVLGDPPVPCSPKTPSNPATQVQGHQDFICTVFV